MKYVGAAGLLAALLLAGCSSGSSGSAAPSTAGTASGRPLTSTPPTPAAGHRTLWLCHPGRRPDPCTSGLSTTVVSGPGRDTVRRVRPARHPGIDCFYVYPTVSRAPGITAPLRRAPEVVAVTRAQAAPFATDCRMFVPVYRQLTTTALASGKFGDPAGQARAYGDVAAAWDDYLRHDNHGRGVVLIGHSQGAIVLRQLIQKQIDQDAAQRRLLVSAVLLGANVVVPAGRVVGGDFANVPLCTRQADIGCVVAYSTFASRPPLLSLFGRTLPGRQVACVSPAQLVGRGDRLLPLLPRGRVLGQSVQGADLAGLAGYRTPYVEFGSGLQGSCRNLGGAHVLFVQGDVAGEPVSSLQQLGSAWGLHVADVNVDLGDLLTLVARQGTSWNASHGG